MAVVVDKGSFQSLEPLTFLEYESGATGGQGARILVNAVFRALTDPNTRGTGRTLPGDPQVGAMEPDWAFWLLRYPNALA
jgi:hypothetical protein